MSLPFKLCFIMSLLQIMSVTWYPFEWLRLFVIQGGVIISVYSGIKDFSQITIYRLMNLDAVPLAP